MFKWGKSTWHTGISRNVNKIWTLVYQIYVVSGYMGCNLSTGNELSYITGWISCIQHKEVLCNCVTIGQIIIKICIIIVEGKNNLYMKQFEAEKWTQGLFTRLLGPDYHSYMIKYKIGVLFLICRPYMLKMLLCEIRICHCETYTHVQKHLLNYQSDIRNVTT
jgi:hypothetical protein